MLPSKFLKSAMKCVRNLYNIFVICKEYESAKWSSSSSEFPLRCLPTMKVNVSNYFILSRFFWVFSATVMLVTLWWWHFEDDDGRIIMLVTFSMKWIGHLHLKAVTNIRHEHQCSLFSQMFILTIQLLSMRLSESDELYSNTIWLWSIICLGYCSVTCIFLTLYIACLCGWNLGKNATPWEKMIEF